MHKLIPLAVFLALSVSPLVATAPVPRKSPELKFLDPTGKEMRLSAFNGKVVVIEFMLVNCLDCLRVAQTMNKLDGEFAPRGFQSIAIAFDNGISGPLVAGFVQHLKVRFPVGYTSSDKVDSYLGRAASERLQVPQIVVIDRKGVIRAQSRPVRELNLEDENYLRNLIDTLLKESAPATSKSRTVSPSNKTSQVSKTRIHSNL